MDVLRGRAPTPDEDRETTARMLARAANEDVPVLRVWTPHRLVAFGRRDANALGYERAKALARKHGFVPVERSVGGRAVAYTGRTLSFAVALPSRTPRTGIAHRYETVTGTVIKTIRRLGASVSNGEPTATFCPGDHSVRVSDGGKIAGIAQRVLSDAALVAGCLIVSRRDGTEIAGVLDPVYRALDVPFDPASVGSVSEAGGPGDPDRVRRHLEAALAESTWGDDRGDGDRRNEAGTRRIEYVGTEPETGRR